MSVHIVIFCTHWHGVHHWQQHQDSWLDWIIKNSTPPTPTPAPAQSAQSPYVFLRFVLFFLSLYCSSAHFDRRRPYINGRLKEDEAITNHDRYQICTLHTGLYAQRRIRDIQSAHWSQKGYTPIAGDFWFYFELCRNVFAIVILLEG